MPVETAVSLTIDRNGIVDLLVKTQQSLRITAEIMRATGQTKNSIAAEVCGAFLESLAAALEHDIDEVLVAQLAPLVRAFGEATGEEDLEHESRVLESQLADFIELIKQTRGNEAKEPLEIQLDTEIVH